MQNNVKLLAIRYLPGSVLLGGGWEGGPGRCWCQDPHLKGDKKGRAFDSCFSIAVVCSPGKAQAVVEVAA